MRLSTLPRSTARLWLCMLGLCGLVLAGCDRSVERELAEHEAAQTSLGVTPREFSQRFNQQLPEVLAALQVGEPAHMARLYQIDDSRLHPGKYEYVLETTVGPAQTTVLGTLDKKGQLRAVGILLTARGSAARDEFLICAESAARSFVTGSSARLTPLIKRMTGVALDNPGQRMTEVVERQLLSVEIVPQGLLFQVQPQQ
ncbi:hypothetical protein [Herbaspirillum sp. YR522]|uniref:hypothetical protein n=1 Tax=Herbaspirillum sp. YR522 TaxID=1144342 RepID=UPI00026F887F|nr:hypothetical protein [Herbaspirillum sp. YR522]EJN00821.1 hypothetical protein PMI40_03402 [Herbaspirillum sp. YR522]